MREINAVPNLDTVLSVIDDYYEKIIDSIRTGYGFSNETAKEIYLHMWIYSHGIATLLATKVCTFSREEISDMLTNVGTSIIRKYKTEGKQ